MRAAPLRQLRPFQAEFSLRERILFPRCARVQALRARAVPLCQLRPFQAEPSSQKRAFFPRCAQVRDSRAWAVPLCQLRPFQAEPLSQKRVIFSRCVRIQTVRVRAAQQYQQPLFSMNRPLWKRRIFSVLRFLLQRRRTAFSHRWIALPAWRRVFCRGVRALSRAAPQAVRRAEPALPQKRELLRAAAQLPGCLILLRRTRPFRPAEWAARRPVPLAAQPQKLQRSPRLSLRRACVRASFLPVRERARFRRQARRESKRSDRLF